MSPGVTPAASERVSERRPAVALARHFREAEGLSIAQIAERLGRSPATVKAYFYDPTGEKARAVKARYVGVCRGCGAHDRAELHPRTCTCGDGRLARVLRPAPLVVRLVAHACASARGRDFFQRPR